MNKSSKHQALGMGWNSSACYEAEKIQLQLNLNVVATIQANLTTTRMWIFENMKPISKCLLGESTIIGVTKCVNITLNFYLYIFEKSQKKHNNFNCQVFLK